MAESLKVRRIAGSLQIRKHVLVAGATRGIVGQLCPGY